MNQSYSNFIINFFDKATKILAYFLLILIVYKYFFIRNNAIMIVTVKEFYIIGFVSIISAIFLSISKKKEE